MFNLYEFEQERERKLQRFRDNLSKFTGLEVKDDVPEQKCIRVPLGLGEPLLDILEYVTELENELHQIKSQELHGLRDLVRSGQPHPLYPPSSREP